MKTLRATLALATALTLGALALGAPAHAAEYPDRPVRVQVGFAAGGGADILARWLVDRIAKASGGAFIVENKVGASGNLALDAAAKARPDGLTLLIASTVTTAGNAAVFKQMPMDVRKDITPVAAFAETPFVIAVAPDSPIANVAQLTDFIKSRNGKATYGSATTSSLATAALYLKAVDAQATHVGYKATANAVQDVTTKQIDMAFADVVYAVGQAKANRIKILAIASDDRSPGLPDVPTLRETVKARTGDIVAHWGLWATAGTPQPILDKLEQWTLEATKGEDARAFLVEQGATPKVIGSAEYKKRFETALQAWEEAVKIAKIEPQ
ncbi:MAG TPA: tripartite tricarboxylate transporter substrate binding protein [Beijerinckiaceae bacterium]|jgi:tripartite-type tricarboxylate transporter receptor subunit TctC